MARLYACSAAVTQALVEEVGCRCSLIDTVISVDDLIDAASDALYVLSGGVMSGVCETVYRPCADGGCVCGFDITCCCCEIVGIPLPQPRPVVTEVKIDGVVFEDWAIVNGYKLVRTDGKYWPGAKNPLLPDTEVGTFSITVETGLAFNFDAQMAAIELVCEMATVLAGKSGQLPSGTVAATKDGVSIVAGRLPGQEEVEAVGLTWLARFLGVYGSRAIAEVRSPELNEGWVLHTVAFNS
jgi:hypothetical protein